MTALVVSADAYNELSDEHKKIVRDLAVENGRFASNMTIEMGDKALEEVAATGVTISEVDLAPFKEAVAPVYEMLNLTAEKDMVNQVLGR